MIGNLVYALHITIWPEFNKQAKSGGEAECNSNQHQRSKMPIPWVPSVGAATARAATALVKCCLRSGLPSVL